MEADVMKDDRSTAVLDGVSALIVEDDAPNARLAALLLTGAGATTRIVHSAEEALVVLEGFRPRVIVIDLVLPRMSGLTFVEHIRGQDWGKDVMVIAVTAINGPAVVSMARASGCDAYVRKPIDGATFAQIVADHLGGP